MQQFLNLFQQQKLARHADFYVNALEQIKDSAYSAILNYVWSHESSLYDYHWFRQPYLLWYQFNHKDRADDILVNNYGNVRYAAVDSVPDIGEYRNYLKPNIRTVAVHLFNNVVTVAQTGFTQLAHVIYTPQTNLALIMGQGANIINEYLTQARPVVSNLGTKLGVLTTLTDGKRPGILQLLADKYYPPVVDYVDNKFGFVQFLQGRKFGIDKVSEPVNVSKITDLIEAKYGNLTALAGTKFGKLDSLTEQKYGKIEYLTEKKFNLLLELLENPQAIFQFFDTTEFLNWLIDAIVHEIRENQ